MDSVNRQAANSPANAPLLSGLTEPSPNMRIEDYVRQAIALHAPETLIGDNRPGLLADSRAQGSAANAPYAQKAVPDTDWLLPTAPRDTNSGQPANNVLGAAVNPTPDDAASRRTQPAAKVIERSLQGGLANLVGRYSPVNLLHSCDCTGILKDALKLNNDPEYGYDGHYGPGPQKNKCNLFVDDALKNTHVAPERWGGFGSPITAGTWADPNAYIPNFPVTTDPQPGDTVAIAYPYDDATGHVAIVVKPGKTSIGAGREGSHITGWPWDTALPPQGTPVYRHCSCQ